MFDLLTDQLETVLQNVADSITVQMPDGRIAYANTAAAQLLGYPSVDTLLSLPLSEITENFQLLDLDGRVIPTHELPGRKALQGERVDEMLVRFRSHPEAQERWLLLKADPVRNDKGEVLYVVNTTRDVTRQQQALEAERKARARAEASEQRLILLGEVSEILARSLDYETTLRQIAELAVSVIADWCAVDLLQADGQLERLAVAHMDPSMVELAYALHERYPPDPHADSGLYHVVRSGNTELYAQITEEMVETGAHDTDHLEILRKLNLSSMIIVPLIARNRVLGALTLASSAGVYFTFRDVEMAEQLADRAALAVDNARLFHEATQANEVLEQHVAERTRELSEAQRVARLGSWSWDVQRNKVTWSEELYRIYGLQRGEFDGTYEGFLSRLHPEDRQVVSAAIEEAYRTHRPFVYYERIFQPDGSIRILLSRGYTETDEEGNVTRMSGTCQDVTEIKRTEEMLRSLLKLSEQLNATLDLDTVLETLTREAMRLVDAESGFSGLNTGSELVTRYYYDHGNAVLINKQWAHDEGVPDWLVRHKRPYLSNDAAHDPLVATDLRDRFHLKSILSVPILDTNGEVVGFFEVINKKTAEGFNSRDCDHLFNLAPIAAIAIENAQLYERQRELSRQVVIAQEEERQHLSRELHDSAGQLLTALSLSLTMLQRKPPAEQEQLQQKLEEAVHLAQDAHEEIRAISHALRPAVLDIGGLSEALENLCRDFGERTQLRINYEGLSLPHVGDQLQVTFYRFLQETLSNVVRHAQASEVQVSLQQEGQVLSLTVTDNGVGFSNSQLGMARSKQGVGLLGLRERFELIDGQIEIESRPGAGTVITGCCCLPLNEADNR